MRLKRPYLRKRGKDRRTVIYFESLCTGDTVKNLKSRQDLGLDAYAKHAIQWIDNGATIVGGCCEIGPAHIARINATIG